MEEPCKDWAILADQAGTRPKFLDENGMFLEIRGNTVSSPLLVTCQEASVLQARIQRAQPGWTIGAVHDSVLDKLRVEAIITHGY